jgi:L-threonylcarbamoyladenylate synthase
MARIVDYNTAVSGGAWAKEIVGSLMTGGVIGYPTETVYGLGGDSTNAGVVDRIGRLKQIENDRPMLVLLGNRNELERWIDGISAKAEVLMDRFWPGPLTLIFKAHSVFPKRLLSKEGRLGLRISPDPVCQVLLSEFRNPLISTSANPHGAQPACSASEVASYFGDGIDWLIDGGDRTGHAPSTVVDVSRDPPQMIRTGSVKQDDIENLIGKLDGTKTI